MEGTEYKTKCDILRHAQESIGIPLGEIDSTGRLKTGKGAIGTVLEESWFGYSPNSEAEPDFPEAEVELKATPYIRTKNGISAKERLVCNIINYMTEYDKTFETSDFWHKCKNILIMSYEHKDNVPKADYTIDKAVLFSFPIEDLIIIEQDWNKIIQKIKEGKAHLLTEGDTLYLAACTKGADSSSVRPQPFSTEPAKQRAYSLKTKYMTYILRSYIFGNKQDPHVVTDWHILLDEEKSITIETDNTSLNTDEAVIKDWHALTDTSFEDVVVNMIRPYYGRTVSQLALQFGIQSKAKNINELILSRMLGVTGKVNNTKEFQNANIITKTIRVNHDGSITESMSFPTFKFLEIIDETWETSKLRNYIEPAKFLFIIFKEDDDGEYKLERVKFWNIPYEDLEELHRVWDRTVSIIKEGVVLEERNNKTYNNLPKSTESRVAHVRPHARDASDTYPLPDGRSMPKQCFWFNNSYLESIINND